MSAREALPYRLHLRALRRAVTSCAFQSGLLLPFVPLRYRRMDMYWFLILASHATESMTGSQRKANRTGNESLAASSSDMTSDLDATEAMAV